MILTKKSRCFFYTHFQEVVILKIYLDVVFLENFLMDYMLLLLTGKILHKQKKAVGMLFAAVIGSSYSVFSGLAVMFWITEHAALWQGTLQLLNLVTAYIMAKCAYESVNAKSACICVATMLTLAFLTGGLLSWMEQTFLAGIVSRSTVFLAVGTVFFGYLFLQRWVGAIRERMHYKKSNLPVILRLQGKQIGCRGLWDSGNSLREPITGRPVVIVEEGLLLRHGIAQPERYFAIPYHAIGTQNGILKGVLADELEIPGQQGEKRWQKVMLGIYEGKISRQDEYQVILHPKL